MKTIVSILSWPRDTSLCKRLSLKLNIIVLTSNNNQCTLHSVTKITKAFSVKMNYWRTLAAHCGLASLSSSSSATSVVP